MIRRICFLLLIAQSLVSGIQAQNVRTSVHWKPLSVCGMTFKVPAYLEDRKAHGIDSCVAVFDSKSMSLSLDYGLYSGVSRQDEYLDFDEKQIIIDGKKGTIATYRDANMRPEQNWVARIFVNVEKARKPWGKIAFNMFIVVRNRAAFTTAEQIFHSIKFRGSSKPNCCGNVTEVRSTIANP